MNTESRVSKSIKNAKVSTFFYFVFLFLSFFSRKIFLEHLGTEFLGLTGTLNNILSLLSLAELGVGTATAYNLYKPIQEGNKERINELVSVFGFLYRKIGLIILGCGIAISLSFFYIFRNIELPMFLVFVAFYSFLISSLLGYFINYRQIVLGADQKAYVVTAYLQGAGFVKLFVQMLIAYYWGNLYVWLGIELVFSFIACIILNVRIRQEYPWLSDSYEQGKLSLKDNKQLITNIKQIIVHRISGFALRESDQIMIFAFVSLKMVALYGNYTIIVDKLSSAVASALGSFSAGVGNLIAEGNDKRSEQVFWEIMSLRYIVAGIIVFCTYHLIEPFITLWLGSQYILDRNILILLLVYVFMDQTRGAVDMFKDGYGLFADTWAPVCEATINVTVTLCTAPLLGIMGLLLGKISSLLIIVFIWKPYYLYKYGFHKNISYFWNVYFKYLFCFIFSFGICHFLISTFSISSSLNFMSWIINGFYYLFLYCIVYLLFLYISTLGTRAIIKRFYTVVIHKI